MDTIPGNTLTSQASYDALQYCWERHQFWAAIASKQKRVVLRSRRLALAFGVIGAIVGTFAAQLSAWPQIAMSFSLFSAGILTVTPFVAKGFAKEQVLKWIRARSASEGLKKEAFLRMGKCGGLRGHKCRQSSTRQHRQNRRRRQKLSCRGPQCELHPQTSAQD